jgi:hypothetical protein
MNESYRALSGRIRLELEELDHLLQRVQKIWRRAESAPDDFLVDAAALNLHGFYAGVERLFASIASQVDRSLPTGEMWHRELLRQMAAEVHEVRPPVISSELLRQLDRYRGFRHVVRNVYAYRLDPRQVGPLVDDLESVWGELRGRLLAFADTLERIGA